MQKQRKVSMRMSFTLYFLGVKESHFVYRPVKVFFRLRDVVRIFLIIIIIIRCSGMLRNGPGCFMFPVLSTAKVRFVRCTVCKPCRSCKSRLYIRITQRKGRTFPSSNTNKRSWLARPTWFAYSAAREQFYDFCEIIATFPKDKSLSSEEYSDEHMRHFRLSFTISCGVSSAMISALATVARLSHPDFSRETLRHSHFAVMCDWSV